MELEPEGKSRLESKSRNSTPSTIPSCNTVTQSPLQVIAATSRVRVQGPFSSFRKKETGVFGAYLVRGFILLSNAVLAMDSKIEEFLFRMNSIRICLERFSDISAGVVYKVVKARR
jgi:hypothetical protein